MKLLAALPLLGLAAALPQSSSSATPSSSSTPSSSASPSSSSGPQGTGSATPPSLRPFTVMAARSASPIHFLPMTANETSFWLGAKTSTYCPPAVEQATGECPPGEDTVIVGGSALDVGVPGGQQIYISSAGALKFTRPHSANIPPGSIKSGFLYEPGQPFGQYTWKGQKGHGFMACPLDNGMWQVFAAVDDAEVPSGNRADCLGFAAMAMAYKGEEPAAWEYV